MQELIMLVRLEMKKNNFKQIICLGGAASGILLLYLLISRFLIQSDSISPEKFFSEVLSVNKIVFTLFIALLINRMFSGEISSKSISILFTYPISRKKLLLTKVALIGMVTMPFMCCSMFIHFILLSILNSIFHFITGDLSLGLAVSYFGASIIHSILATLTAFIPIYIDVKYASAQRTIISAVIMGMFLYNMMDDSFFGISLFILVVTAIAGVYSTKKSLELVSEMDVM